MGWGGEQKEKPGGKLLEHSTPKPPSHPEVSEPRPFLVGSDSSHTDSKRLSGLDHILNLILMYSVNQFILSA